MRFSAYRHGLDILGAEVVGADAVSTNRAILIKVKNPAELAKSQGSIASIAQTLAPATIEKKIYDEMAKKLGAALKAEHVDAEVTIVEPNAFQAAVGSSHIATDIALAVGGLAAVALLWRVFSGSSK